MSVNREAEVQAGRHLLHHYNYEGGYEGGSFTRALIGALEAADNRNKLKLIQAFPEWQLPLTIMQIHGGQALRSWVARSTDELKDEAKRNG